MTEVVVSRRALREQQRSAAATAATAAARQEASAQNPWVRSGGTVPAFDPSTVRAAAGRPDEVRPAARGPVPPVTTWSRFAPEAVVTPVVAEVGHAPGRADETSSGLAPVPTLPAADSALTVPPVPGQTLRPAGAPVPEVPQLAVPEPVPVVAPGGADSTGTNDGPGEGPGDGTAEGDAAAHDGVATSPSPRRAARGHRRGGPAPTSGADEHGPLTAARSASGTLEMLRDIVGLGSRGGRRSWVRTIQTLVAIAAVITIVVGVRTMFAPASASSVPYSATFPQALAVSTAERFTEAYFTWDEDDPAARSSALAGVMQRGLPAQAGWDGNGRSTARSASAVGFTIVDSANALVTVVATVAEASDSDGSSRGGSEHQVALSIPVAVSGARVWVSGLPASVGVPVPATASQRTTGETDADTTSATSAAVGQYFASIASDDVTTAPAAGAGTAAVSTGLDGVLRYRSVVSWSVVKGSGDLRTGLASVRWATATGVLLEQDYRVVVSKDVDHSWHVRSVTAALPSEPTG